MAESDGALNIAILRGLGSDLGKQLALSPQLADAARRHDRRFAEIDRRFDETGRRIAETRVMVQSEWVGRLTPFETRMDERLARPDDRIAARESARP